MVWRASSSLSLLPARICCSVCGVVAGALLRCVVTTRALGRRRTCTTCGAVTLMLGNAVMLPADGACVCAGAGDAVGAGVAAGAGVGAGACASAVPSRLNRMSAAAPQAAATDLEGSDIILIILIPVQVSAREFGAETCRRHVADRLREVPMRWPRETRAAIRGSSADGDQEVGGAR